MPFRYGISTMTVAPHLFLRVELAVDGQRAHGVAADHLPPKWFTKEPGTPFRDDVAEMIRVIRHAAEAVAALPGSPNLYSLWQQLYSGQTAWAAREAIPPLLANVGGGWVEGAAMGAFGGLPRTPFPKALQQTLLGIDATLPLALLPREPLRSIIARHTVGLTDPITADDIPPAERLD